MFAQAVYVTPYVSISTYCLPFLHEYHNLNLFTIAIYTICIHGSILYIYRARFSLLRRPSSTQVVGGPRSTILRIVVQWRPNETLLSARSALRCYNLDYFSISLFLYSVCFSLYLQHKITPMSMYLLWGLGGCVCMYVNMYIWSHDWYVFMYIGDLCEV